MGVAWTPEQKQAIDQPSGMGNILVSAAAGSGKTAVLVERIFEKVSKNKIDIDKFLVVTFTTAAASGMKAKIEERFRDELTRAAVDEKEFWSRQLRLVDMAEITTIDAFCVNILRNNFQYIGIDPNFVIMDTLEYKLMRENVINDLFDKLYEEQDEGFLMLVEQYATFRSDDKLVKLIFNIHDFISCFAEPLEWLREKTEMYTEDMENSPWIPLCINGYVHPVAENVILKAKTLLNGITYTVTGLDSDYFNGSNTIAVAQSSYKPIASALEKVCTAMNELLAVTDFEGMCEWNRKYINKSELFKEGLPARITKAYKEIEGFEYYAKETKELAKEIESDLSLLEFTSIEEFANPEQLPVIKRTAAELCRITEMLDNEMTKIKHKRNAYTFSDIEHMTYNLFKSNPDINRSYTDKYYEILIDEYQDTNGLQDAVFESISKQNIFMVGDLKQSIYLFRGGDPYIFKSKSIAYADGKGTRIDLAKNFRSRSEIIDSVNSVFDAVMSDRAGDVDYSGSERLIAGKTDERKDFYRSEMHILKRYRDSEVEADNEHIEAEYIAKKILELKGKPFFDSKKGVTRGLTYSDFTILLRATSSSASVYSDVFEKYNIPLLVELNDYFENTEIKAMTALISVIDNPRQDVPLITALRSALFNFTDSELAHIKINFGGDKRYFYDKISDCAKADDYLSKRCKKVIDSVNRWRRYIKQKSVASLIWTVYEETGFYDCAAAVGGEAAQANLRLLYERAKRYENSGFKGLFSFTKYIENLKERSNDMTGARALRHDTVGLMTIHKSKGLEFPVVFLGGMGKDILAASARDDRRIALHKDFGLGLMYPDTENEFYHNTVYKTVVDFQNRREELSEKMRVLYVAMTRAQYKLIALGTYTFKDTEAEVEQMEKWNNAVKNGKMDLTNVTSSRRYGDWVIPAAMHSKDWDLISTEIKNEQEAEAEQTADEKAREIDEPALRDAVYKILDYKYPYAQSTVIPSRTTATEMKEIRNPRQPFINNVSKPAFMTDAVEAAKKGTAYHNAVAYIDFEVLKTDLSPETVGKELERLSADGYIDEKYIDGKLIQKLLAFFNGEQGTRLLNAKKVYREKSFQVLMDSCEYDTSIPPDKSEKMILQGVIDCFFEENDGNIVLLDYKTDKIINGDTKPAEANYTLQLELYSKAIREVAGLEVNEKYLYLFDIDKAVRI